MPERFLLMDPIRGFAAAWVFLFHYHFSATFRSDFAVLHQFTRLGDRAVPLFFVISGYCIALSATRGLQSAHSSLEFLKRRLWRIYPAFWCSILVILGIRCVACLCRILGLIDPLPYMSYPSFPDYSLGEYLQIGTLTHALVSRDGAWWTRYGQLHGAYWTLALEVQFYVAVAVLMRLRRYFTLGLVFVSVVSLTVWFHRPWMIRTANYGTAVPYWSWFAWGVLLFYVHKAGFTPQRVFGSRATIAASIITAAVLASVIVSSYAAWPYERQLFAFVSGCGLWALLAFDDRFAVMVKSRNKLWSTSARIAVSLGAASYTIYLLHGEVSHAFEIGLRAIPGLPDLVLDLTVVVSTMVCCWGCYFIIERPFTRKRAAQKPRIVSYTPEHSQPSLEKAERAA